MKKSEFMELLQAVPDDVEVYMQDECGYEPELNTTYSINNIFNGTYGSPDWEYKNISDCPDKHKITAILIY